jgi:hypothetical protein
MSRRAWMILAATLLLVVAIGVALQAIRPSSNGPTSEQPSPATAMVAQPFQLAASARPAPSAACTELLSRIRSCSAKELDGIADKLGGMEALLLYRQLSSSDRQDVFAALPPPLLARKANELLGIPENRFRNDGNAGRIASALVDVAMGVPMPPGAQLRRELCFSTEVDDQHVPQHPLGAFRPTDRRIYACLDAAPEAAGEPGVLVRWTEEESGALVYLNYLPFALNRTWNNVFFEVTEAWTPGRYRVAFYRIAESVSLLAEGTYIIGKVD